MVRDSHSHQSSGAWSLKDRTDAVVSPGTRGRAKSTRILGIGIVLVGVVVLAVGLIMGLEFPEYVHKQIKEKQCVVYPGHEKYPSWSQGSQWTRQVNLYYWTLDNADGFLYKGEKPRFVERGPYVYTELESRYDVNFAVTEVSFRLQREYLFDREATALSCSDCHEYEKLTLLSPWYLQTVGQYGGEEALNWACVALYTSYYLKSDGLLYRENDDDVFNQNVSLLGIYATGQLQVINEPLLNFSFGAWLQNSSSDYRSTIETRRSGRDFALSEMISLYRVLTNITLFGGTALSTSNRTLQLMCKRWAQKICSQAAGRTKVVMSVMECGVIYIFTMCQRNISSEALNILQQIFCSSTSTISCLDFTNLPDDLVLAYTRAVLDFVRHLSASVLGSFLESSDLSLVISKNQSQLALGYDVKGDEVMGEYHVTGLLQSNWIGDVSGAVPPLWRVYTCLHNRNMDDNMKVIEYDNSWSYLGTNGGDQQEVSVSSFTDFVTSCQDLRTCQTCESPGLVLNIFVERLLRAIPFLLNSSTAMGGVTVFRYELDPNAFNYSNQLHIVDGLQDMVNMAGYLAWASLPQYTGEHWDHVTMETDQQPTNSYILMEPVTGRVWNRSFNLQWNVGISNETAHYGNRNIDMAELPLPLVWTESKATITRVEMEAHKHLVSRLMIVSCGGVIGFSVIAIIIVFIGVVVCMYPAKPNRISPIVEENLNSFPNGRHL